MNVFLMAVAGVWGVSALAIVAIFIVDERAHRRRQAAEAAAVESAVTAPTGTALPVPERPLATSGTR